MSGWSLQAGSRPGGRGTFLCFAKEQVPKRKASRRQGRCAVPCAARVGWGLARTRFAQTIASPDPPAAALLSPASTAVKHENQAHKNAPWRVLVSSGITCSCLVSCGLSFVLCVCPRSPAVMRRRAAQGRAEKESQMSERPQGASFCGSRSARATQRARRADESGCRFFWVLFFGRAKKRISAAGPRPGLPRNPGCHSKEQVRGIGVRARFRSKPFRPTRRLS